MVYNIVLVSSVQQSDPIIYIIFYILFHYALSRNIGYNSLYYTVGP